MKRTFLMSIILLLFISTGCTYNSGIPEKSASPISDFEHKDNEEGGTTITKYTGTAQDIIIPSKIEEKTVTQIGPDAFRNNDTIISVEIPNSVTAIEGGAFESCAFLSSVSLPRSLKLINTSAFSNCVRLTSVILPNTVTYLGIAAFENCTLLKHINIPKGITKICKEAFQNSGIEAIDFEEGIEKIEACAFASTKIKTVVLPKSVREIADGAFCLCADLESVTLNEGLTTIGIQALAHNPKLTEIVVPASVNEINETAFNGCKALQAVKFKGNAPESYQCEEPEILFDVNYIVYYHKNASGFTSPKWCGYPTKIW